MMFILGFITAIIAIAMWACVVCSSQISREEEKSEYQKRQ